MNPREKQEALEEQFLSPQASLSSRSKGRENPDIECEIRTCYQRDIDRIIHSKAFRRLKHKTQVFLSPEGDHYRTRLTHTLEVARISRTIARGLRLNEDLCEAIAFGHDLGHTPFGHAGERALREILKDEGGFEHNEQSIRVVEYLEQGGRGLNLTWEVRDGILCHTGKRIPETPEGKIVKTSDRIAYINHDIDDAGRAGVLRTNDIPEKFLNLFGKRHSERINTLVLDMIEESSKTGEIALSPGLATAFDEFRAFMYDRVYLNMDAKREESKVAGIIEGLFEQFCKAPEKMSEEYRRLIEKDGIRRAVADYISGMTDKYAVFMYERFFVPEAWQVR